MDYRTSYRLMLLGIWGGGIAVLVGMFLGRTLSVGNIIAGVGAAAMVVGLGQALVFYKCPHCGNHFNIRGAKPDYCPKCGGKLEL